MSFESYKGKKVLITGGLGFIGSSLALRLVGLGARVTVIDSLIPQYGGNLFNVEPVKDLLRVNISDVRDRSSINYLVQGQDFLFNLAGTLSHIDSMRDPFTDLEINCVSQLRILEACRENNPGVKIVFAGTRGQFGRATYLPVDEEHPLRPTDVNGINNIAGEQYHLLYSEVYGIRACSLRLTNTYGPRHQMRHARQGVLNWFVRQVIEGEKIRIYGDGSQIRDTNYIEDVVEALLLAMITPETDGQVYNLGGEPLSLVNFVEQLITLNGSGAYELVAYPQDLKPIEIGDYIASHDKFSRCTGWHPRVPLVDGLQCTLDYYRKNRHEYW
ncbi:NAD-dependent epimerase/dehydratase family protein [Geomonas sp. RF6]|uniref:NAD-dependent epimerase/dehydratase family protein n=1 Tax=Geomonas sp. RF6 TaxID=2897342 RepID=UPI001E518F7A|nr:NAD-dependent epimerase/dehydratase family protein [Geomonas sp. RF6]UFS69729.1 NAD-dependent epimerase/dehydratase family protein [Geomonas sp. RF6]